jgi:hypothetical protein
LNIFLKLVLTQDINEKWYAQCIIVINYSHSHQSSYGTFAAAKIRSAWTSKRLKFKTNVCKYGACHVYRRTVTRSTTKTKVWISIAHATQLSTAHRLAIRVARWSSWLVINQVISSIFKYAYLKKGFSKIVYDSLKK